MNSASSVLLISTISGLIYWNSIWGGFVFDDHRAILTNDDLDSSKTSLFEVFTHDFWGGAMSRRESHKSYRPVTVLSYRYLNYYFAELNPLSYHCTNVILHTVVCILFLPVVELVYRGKRVGEKREDGATSSSSNYWSLLTVLLFTTHSIHTEAVASVVGRAELLCCIFFLLSFLSYTRALYVSSSITCTHSSIVPNKTTSIWFIILSIFLALLSMLSKEQGITVIGVCAAYDILLHWNEMPLFGNSLTIGKENYQFTDKFKAVLKRICFLGVAGTVLMWLRIAMNQGGDPIFKPDEMRAAFHPNRTVRILSFGNIYAWNMWLLLAPSTLCCDWSLGSIPIIDTFTDARNMWSIVLYIGIGALVIATLKGDKQVGIGLAFMIIPFLPSSGLLVRVGFVIAERVLYLPSLGYCLLVMIGAKRLSQKTSYKKFIQILIVFVLIVMSTKTISRNWDWWSDLSLFSSGVKANPNNVKLHNNYGMELKTANRIKEAEHHYKIAMQIESDYAEVYFNYGNLLSETKDYENALYYFEKAMTYPHMYSKTLNNAATMYYRLGKYKQAEEKFKASLELNPDQPMTYNNLASLYGETKRYTEAKAMFKKTIEMNPTYTEAYFNLGTLLYQMGQVEEGEKYLYYALKLNPRHHGALNNLKVIEYYRNKKKQ